MIRACRDALVFTDPKGYRFLLPAWLTLDLRGQLETCDAMDYLPSFRKIAGIMNPGPSC